MNATVEDRGLFVFVRLHARAGNEARVVDALMTVVTASRAEPGCASIHAFRSVRDPLLFFIHSVWRSAEAFEHHATLPHTVEFIEAVDQLLAAPREVVRTIVLT